MKSFKKVRRGSYGVTGLAPEPEETGTSPCGCDSVQTCEGQGGHWSSQRWPVKGKSCLAGTVTPAGRVSELGDNPGRCSVQYERGCQGRPHQIPVVQLRWQGLRGWLRGILTDWRHPQK